MNCNFYLNIKLFFSAIVYKLTLKENFKQDKVDYAFSKIKQISSRKVPSVISF